MHVYRLYLKAISRQNLHILNWTVQFQNGLAHFRTAANFKMSQISNQPVTYIASYIARY